MAAQTVLSLTWAFSCDGFRFNLYQNSVARDNIQRFSQTVSCETEHYNDSYLCKSYYNNWFFTNNEEILHNLAGTV